MKWHPVAFLMLLLLLQPLQADADARFLLRAKRQASDDLTTLRGAGLGVVHETLHSLFLEGTHADLMKLGKLGFDVEILDRDPDRSDYVQVGLLPDSDGAVLFELGAELFAEENWKLIRVARDASLEPLLQARVFATRLSHEPMALPRSSPVRAAADLGTPDPLIQRMVNAVDPVSVNRYWTDLTENPPSGTRYTLHQGSHDAAFYAQAEMALVGVPAELHYFGLSTDFDHGPNVIGTHPGAVTPDHIYIVIGHLDDVPISGPAPGADDNASGSVTVLESARIMSCYAFRSTIKFINAGGEELGLLGSHAWAEEAQARGDDIRGVLNFDMIGWQGDGSPDPENLDLSYNDPSEDLALLFVQSAADYNTGLVIDAFPCPSQTVSDHYSFWQFGYKAICGATENHGYCGRNGNNPYYHTADDTIANCGDPSFFYRTIRTAVATLATLAEPFKVTFESPTVALGQSARLLVGDRDLNGNPSTVETVVVEVWSTTEPTAETFALSEEGPDSMIFAGDVPTTTHQPVAGDGAVSVSDTDVISVRYVDALDCDGTLDRTYTDTAAADGTGLIPVEVTDLTVGPASATRLEWNGLTNATGYDVAGGMLAELRQDGDFGRSACLADDVSGGAWDDPRANPAPGSGYYYLLRAQNANGPGTYGSGNGAERIVSACP